MHWAETGILGFINHLAGLSLLASILLGAVGLIVRPFRKLCGLIVYLLSWILGLSTWLWCAQIVHALWGTIAMCVGILFFGVGVAPLAIAASLLHGNWSAPIGIIISFITIMVARIGGEWMSESGDRKRESEQHRSVVEGQVSAV